MLILDGCAARSKLSRDGGRQIVSLHIAGDLIDLHSAIMKVSDHDVSAIGPLRIAAVPHENVMQAATAAPGIAMALWRETLADAALSREWQLNVGQRDAYRHTAHLLCEMGLRYEAVGLFARDCYMLPLTQSDLGDTTGVSPIHTNRVLQRLRSEGLIVTHSQQVGIPDWDALADAGEFEPGYLYLPT